MRIDFPTAGQIPQLRTLWKLAFGDSDAFLDAFFATGFAPERCRCGILDGQIATALYWFDVTCEGREMAYLYAVATHPAYRRRGLCRELLADTHDLLARRGCAATLLVPENGALRQMYGKLGYQDFGGQRKFSCLAGETPCPIRRIDWEEYACLRRSFLPPGGVIQEGASLSYLAAFANAYTGPDLLLAAAEGEDGLHGLELLGRETAAPAILRALGHTRGTFAVPGKAPFAMYHPLAGPVPAPGYFGLDLA